MSRHGQRHTGPGHPGTGPPPGLPAAGAALIDVDPHSPVPPYEQIRIQLTDLIESGVLAAGAKLPPIRQLAGDLDLAPGTVARAYRALDMAGLVSGRARTGTTVTARPRPSPEQAQQRLNRAAQAYAATVRALGLSHEQALAALNRHAGDLTAG